MGWELAHECLPEYHCCVHDECLEQEDDDSECVLFGMTKDDAAAEIRARTAPDGEEDGAS